MSTTVVRREVSTPTTSSPSTRSPSSQPSADRSPPDPAAIQRRLAAALPTVGVQAGTSQSRAPNPDTATYHGLIRSTLERHWNKPTSVPPGREALVRLRISPDGSLTALGLARPSGDSALDQSALEAVSRAGKLPRPLPEGLGNPDYEVVVNFKLD